MFFSRVFEVVKTLNLLIPPDLKVVMEHIISNNYYFDIKYRPDRRLRY